MPKFVPSNSSPVPLVATLLPFRYSTPLAVPPERVGLAESVRTPEEVKRAVPPVVLNCVYPEVEFISTLLDGSA